MGDDSRIPPLSRRVPGATNWPTPPVRATPPELPEHLIERLRAKPNRASEAATALAEAERPGQSVPPPPRTGTAPGLPRAKRRKQGLEPRERLPVRVLWQATSDSAQSREVDTDDSTEPIPVIAAAAGIPTETVLPARADTQPDSAAAQLQPITALAPPATLPRRVPGSHDPQPSPGRGRGVTAAPRPADPLPAEAESRTEPIPALTAAVARGPAGPVSAAPQVPAQTMLRPLFAESDTLEQLLASVRAQADVHTVHARRVRMTAIGVAVIVVILAVVLLV